MQGGQRGQGAGRTVVVERDGRFFAYEAGLTLIGSGSTFGAAYANFLTAKRSYYEELEKAGLEVVAIAPQPKREMAVRGVLAELGLFLAKASIVLVLIAGLSGAAVASVLQLMGRLGPEIVMATNVVSEALKPLANISMIDVANKMEVVVRDVQAMPEERKESLRRSIGILSREVAPIVEAWRNPPP